MANGSQSGNGQERRTKDALRALIDEMMAQIRTANDRGFWTTEDRERAESDLARIMESVRREAVSDRTKEP